MKFTPFSAYSIFFSIIFLLVSQSSYAQINSKPLRVIISSDNLSEDMNVLSTKNDELLVLGYKYEEESILNEPIFVYEFIFDENKKNKSILTQYNTGYEESELLLFLIELDTEKTIEQIDPVIRVHHKEISKLHSEND